MRKIKIKKDISLFKLLNVIYLKKWYNTLVVLKVLHQIKFF